MEHLRVVFIGGLSNGLIVYNYLKSNKFVEVPLAITYKLDYSGARYIALPDDDNIIRSSTCRGYERLVAQINPDLIIVAGWSELIPDEIINLPKMGCLGFHPAKLPRDRGRSVLAWQIEDGYTETALTMFRYSNYPDGGDIYAQEVINIDEDDYINDVLDKVDKATRNIMRAYFPLIRQGLLKPRKQDLSEGSFRRLRGSDDSVIDWNQSSQSIYNKIRAISHPYPGATSIIDGGYCLLWRAEIVKNFAYGNESVPGTQVAKLYDGSIIIKTRDSFIRITEYSRV